MWQLMEALRDVNGFMFSSVYVNLHQFMSSSLSICIGFTEIYIPGRGYIGLRCIYVNLRTNHVNPGILQS